MNSRIEGIEYLRAIMSIFVVIWHMEGGGQSLIFSKNYLEHVFTVSDFVNFHLLLLAVPTFIFISIFLYASHRADKIVLKKRLKRILILLTFWPITFIIYNNSFTNYKGYQRLPVITPTSLNDFIFTILKAGDTIYYFFTSLIICLLISHLFIQLRQRFQILFFLLSTGFLACLPEITKQIDLYPLSAYWSPLNFIPFSFAAVLVAQNRGKVLANRKIILFTSIVLCILFSIFEWKYSIGSIFYYNQGFAIPAYTRTSLLFSVIAIFVIALDQRIKSTPAIKFMARYSLALYCLHPFLIIPIRNLVAIFIQNKVVCVYVSITVVIALSYLIAILLRKYYIRDEVMI